MHRTRRDILAPTFIFSSWVIALLPTCLLADAKEPRTVGPDHAKKMERGLALFSNRVRGILETHCLDCHGGRQTKGDFDLATRDKLLDSGFVDLGNPAESWMLALMRHDEEPRMPFRKPKMSAEDIAAVAEWLEADAPYDRPLRDEAAKAAEPKEAVTAADRDFWAFRRLKPVEVPQPKDTSWARNPIDRFTLSRMEAAGLQPNPPASDATLRRRLWLDIVGLPPAMTDANESKDEDLDRLADRLLASPAHGERWARHWLDVARFAESAGFESDKVFPDAYRYRDFVIQALNDDLPYDRFIQWQIAGDRLRPDHPPALVATGFLAVGPYQSPVTVNELESARYDELYDFVQTLGAGMLGITIGCARCHDHKYDPIPAADYYSMVANFSTTVRGLRDLQPRTESDIANARHWRTRQAALEAEATEIAEREQLKQRLEETAQAKEAAPEFRQRLQKKGKAVAKSAFRLLESGQRFDHLSRAQRTTILADFGEWASDDYRAVIRAIREHERAKPVETDKSLAMSDRYAGVAEKLPRNIQGPEYFDVVFELRRGDPNQKHKIAKPGFLSVLTAPGFDIDHWRRLVPALAPVPLVEAVQYATPRSKNRTVEIPGVPETTTPDSPRSGTSFADPGLDRAALALWLTDVDHGAGALLARVAVNRLWHWHFGRGLATATSDLGFQSEPPTHPELLDWLAGELIASGWSLRHVHRLIVTSATYRQSSRWDKERSAKDPDERFWSRWRPRRLEAEAVRDSLLAIAGQLDSRRFGPSFREPDQRRRAIYRQVRRSEIDTMLAVFDVPDALEGIGQRDASTVPAQALMLMNAALIQDAAGALSRSLIDQNFTDDGAVVEAACRAALGRAPDSEERKRALAFIDQRTAVAQASSRPRPRQEAMKEFCQVMLCLNETIYID